jgi:hypothetical protein
MNRLRRPRRPSVVPGWQMSELDESFSCPRASLCLLVVRGQFSDTAKHSLPTSVFHPSRLQTSVAATFIKLSSTSDLTPDWADEWAHADIAGPSFRDGRLTGYGIALVVELAHAIAEGKV